MGDPGRCSSTSASGRRRRPALRRAAGERRPGERRALYGRRCHRDHTGARRRQPDQPQIERPIARDGRGRERREHQAMVVGPDGRAAIAALVTITDPVAGTAVTIDHERQLATRLTAAPLAAGAPAPPGPRRRGRRAWVPPAAVRGAGRPAPRWRWTGSTGAGFKTAVPRAPRRARDVGPRSTRRPSRACGPKGRGPPSPFPPARSATSCRSQIVSERWYSPELKAVVLSRRADPRFGETVFRLINLVRGEPGADFFEIPGRLPRRRAEAAAAAALSAGPAVSAARLSRRPNSSRCARSRSRSICSGVAPRTPRMSSTKASATSPSPE